MNFTAILPATAAVLPPTIPIGAVSAQAFSPAVIQPSAPTTSDSTSRSAARFGDTLMSAGIVANVPLGDAISQFMPHPPNEVLTVFTILVGGGLLALFGIGGYVYRRNNGDDLARKYYGEEFSKALQSLESLEIGDRDAARNHVELLVKAARTVERVINLHPSSKRTTEIDELIADWQFYALGRCYITRLDVGVPARALLTLSEKIPNAFTKKQYDAMKSVPCPGYVPGGHGYVPTFSQYLKDAANKLSVRFDNLAATPFFPNDPPIDTHSMVSHPGRIKS